MQELILNEIDAIVPAPAVKSEVTKNSAPAPSKVTPSKPKAVIEKSGKVNTPILTPKIETPKIETPAVVVPKAEIPKIEEPEVETTPKKIPPPPTVA